MQLDNVERLTSRQLSEVLRLADAATLEDSVPPLSEQVLLAARGDRDTDGVPHFLAYDGKHLAGYAHLERGLAAEVATAEVVVDPGHRRQGVGTLLSHALEEGAAGIPLQLWSHGQLASARAFAERDGYSTVRELWQMCRSLRSSGSLPDVSLPEGFTTRHLVVGQDEDAWLRVNARAFVDHPEQGRMTRADLDQRIAEPWFDAKGLILIEDMRGPVPVLAASHWTKVVPTEDPPASPTKGENRVIGGDPQASASEGEVYVVGVDPAYQGRGLGRAVTILGLAHLRERGLSEATLYVEADNRAAIATYSRLGFVRCGVDIMYSRTVHSPV